ncbi:MAG: phosphoribosylglycinamide formyltransferase [Hyphomicrobiales bacterium]|nr:phosphoribosylglycinamide formyltransferase [Hyphomicrobiales bacterium]
MRLAILFSGRGSNMLALAEACAARPKAELALTICNRPHAPGIAAARARGLPVQVLDHTDYASREDFEAALQRALVAAKTELVCAAGFMRLFSPAFVARWHNRLLNIHPSLLPHFPGLNTHQRALKAGMRESGCSVHFIRARMDAGPILVQAKVPIKPQDTPEQLAQRVLAEEHRAYVLALDLLLDNKLDMCGEQPFLSAPVDAPPHFVLPPLRRESPPRERKA